MKLQQHEILTKHLKAFKSIGAINTKVTIFYLYGYFGKGFL